MTAPRETPWWEGLDLDAPDDGYLDRLRERVDALFAQVHALPDRGPVFIDHAALEAWEESRARDYDVEQVS